MLDQKQLQHIWLLSDTVLYPEAVAFLRKLAQQNCNPLPASQVNGLLTIAESENYGELRAFVLHQRDRNWPNSKRDIKTFYTALEETLSQMRQKRLQEWHLLRGADDINKEADALMALLAREFIQHLLAENGVLAAEWEEQRQHAHAKAGGKHGS